MSLINDALKKAQQLQTQGQAPPPPIPGSASGAPGLPADSTHSASSGQASSPRASSGRERSMPGQIFMLLAFGAGALIAVSVLATVYLLRQPAALSPTGAAAPALPVLHSFSEGGSLPNGSNPPSGPIAPEKPAPAPVISAPALALPQTIPPPTPGEIIATTPAQAVAKLPTPPAIAPVPVTTPAVATASNSSSSILPPTIVMPQPPTPNQPALPVLRSFSEGGSPPNGSNPSNGPDPKILAYLDALQVAGIRVSDTGSKVLMNDRVYRECEIVDHLLGLRLKKVESDTLTFVDERGVVYTKNF